MEDSHYVQNASVKTLRSNGDFGGTSLNKDLYHTLKMFFYTNIACRNPLFRLKYNFPSCKIARQFSLPDFDGAVDIRGMRNKTFGEWYVYWQTRRNVTT